MKDENIKEILEDVKRHLDYVEATKQASIRDNEMKAMYDYITNLQTIEREYSSLLSENAELENKITNLQEENQRYKRIFEAKERFSKVMSEDTDFIILSKADYDRQQEDIELTAIELKTRNEEAIEYITTEQLYTNYQWGKSQYVKILKDLLEILQGKSDE